MQYLLWCLPFFRFFLSLRLGGVSWHLGRSCEPSVSTTLLFRTSWSVAFTHVRNCTLMPCSQVALGPLVNEIHESVVFLRPPFRDWHEWDGINVVCHTWRNARLSSILSCQVRRENMWMPRVLWSCCAPMSSGTTMFWGIVEYVMKELVEVAPSTMSSQKYCSSQVSFGTEACRFHNTSFLSLTKRDADIRKHVYVTVMLSTPGSSSVHLPSFPPRRHWRCLL